MKEIQWSDEFGYITNGKVFLRGYFDYPDRQIGEVKLTQEASIKYFQDRFELARQKVEDLYQLVDNAQNKGSYLMKLIHLREYLAAFDGLGDFPALFRRLDELEDNLRGNISQNRVKNLEIKQGLIKEAEVHKDSTEWRDTAEVYKELKSKWIRTGAAPKENEEELEKQFNEVVDGFFNRRKAYFDHKNRIIKMRLAQFEELLNKANALKESEDWEATITELKKMQEQWKALGKIPKREAKEYKDNFRAAYDYFFARFRKAKNIPDRPYVKKVDPRVLAQEKLAKQAEELLQQSNMEEAAEKGKQLLVEWKNMKLHPKAQDPELSDRFRMACDKIFELNYLMRVVKRKNFFFDKKSREEQLTLKIKTMSDLIRKDKQDLELYESNPEALNMLNRSQGPDNKVVGYKLDVQKRKIGVKQMLLDQFKAELASLRQYTPR